MTVRHLAAATCVAASLAPQAFAAEATDVVDAFDEASDNPFDVHIEPTFRQQRQTGTIAREHACSDCEEPQIDYRRELDYRIIRNELDFAFQLGLHRDFELHLDLPIVISQTTTLEYADGVNETNSSVDPADSEIEADLDPSFRDYYDGPSGGTHFGTYRFFDVPYDGARRSGLGDMIVGFAWAPFNDARQTWASALRLAVDYMAPTGKPMRGDNTGVGRGTHELRVGLAASRQFHQFVEPYFTFAFAQPFAARNGLFSDDSPNSTTRAPGGRLDFSAGSELILFSDAESGQHYTFDAGLGFGYAIEGRDYTALSEALATSPCSGISGAEVGPIEAGGTNGNAYTPSPSMGVSAANARCAWVAQQPSTADDPTQPIAAQTFSHDGITDVEGFATVSGRTGVNLQFSPYVEVRFGLLVKWLSPHLITAADSGRDGDGSDVVELDPAPEDGNVERNPYYNLALDAVGRRFRQEGALDIGWSLAAAFQF